MISTEGDPGVEVLGESPKTDSIREMEVEELGGTKAHPEIELQHLSMILHSNINHHWKRKLKVWIPEWEQLRSF